MAITLEPSSFTMADSSPHESSPPEPVSLDRDDVSVRDCKAGEGEVHYHVHSGGTDLVGAKFPEPEQAEQFAALLRYGMPYEKALSRTKPDHESEWEKASFFPTISDSEEKYGGTWKIKGGGGTWETSSDGGETWTIVSE